MHHNRKLERPAFAAAADYFRNLLRRAGRPDQVTWVFREHLVITAFGRPPSPIHIDINIHVPFPDQGLVTYAYDWVRTWKLPIVLQAIGTFRAQTVATILCDDWFDAADVHDGYDIRDDWGILFAIGTKAALNEASSTRGFLSWLDPGTPPLTDYDFALTMTAVREHQQHGRVLTRLKRALRAIFM